MDAPHFFSKGQKAVDAPHFTYIEVQLEKKKWVSYRVYHTAVPAVFFFFCVFSALLFGGCRWRALCFAFVVFGLSPLSLSALVLERRSRSLAHADSKAVCGQLSPSGQQSSAFTIFVSRLPSVCSWGLFAYVFFFKATSKCSM